MEKYSWGKARALTWATDQYWSVGLLGNWAAQAVSGCLSQNWSLVAKKVEDHWGKGTRSLLVHSMGQVCSTWHFTWVVD